MWVLFFNAMYTFLMAWQVQQDACRGKEETQTEEKQIKKSNCSKKKKKKTLQTVLRKKPRSKPLT